jgi:hypothetical protein
VVLALPLLVFSFLCPSLSLSLFFSVCYITYPSSFHYLTLRFGHLLTHHTHTQQKDMVAPARPQFVLFGSSIVQLSYSHTGWGSFLSDIYSRKVIHIHSFFFFSSLILHFLNTSFIISRFYLQCHNNYLFLLIYFLYMFWK